MKFHKDELLLTCSAGGHLTQLLKVAGWMAAYNKILITERTKNTGQMKSDLFNEILFIPHGGREEGIKYLFKLGYNFIISFFRYLKYRPKIVISTGAHTALPMLLIAKLFGSKVIFIETFAKIKSPSLTGRIIYKVADSFYIQWPELTRFYPEAKYKGKIY